MRCRHRPAISRNLSEADIVEQDDDDVRGAVGRRRKLRPFAFGVLVGLADLSAEWRFAHREFRAVELWRCWRAFSRLDLLCLHRLRKGYCAERGCGHGGGTAEQQISTLHALLSLRSRVV